MYSFCMRVFLLSTKLYLLSTAYPCVRRMLSDQLLDLSALLKQSAPHVPILVLYNGEQEVAERLVSDLAQSRQVDTLRMTLTGHTSGEDKTARALVQRAIAQVTSIYTAVTRNSSMLTCWLCEVSC